MPETGATIASRAARPQSDAETNGGNVRRIRWTSLVVAVALSLAATATVASAQGTKEKLQATDAGVTADTINITLVAAIDVPGISLFGGTARGVQAWAEYMNDNGGLAGRKIKVNVVDSKLSGDEARNAFIQACDDSFALIGTSVLLLSNFDDLINCKDKAGATTGLPDFPVVVTEVAQQCSPVSYAINPAVIDCATKDQHPQTYRSNTGPSGYYVKKNGKLKGAFLYPDPTQSASAKAAQVPNFTAQDKKGISMVYTQDLSSLATQSEYTPVAASIKEKGATYARSGLAVDSTVKLRKEAKLQGVDGVKVWDCSLQCYDQSLLDTGGADVEGQNVYMPFLPFLGKGSEASTNKLLKAFLKYDKEPDGFGLQAFAAGILFRDAVNKVVAGGNNNALTRKAVLAAVKDNHAFDADGILGTTDVGGKVPSPCFVLTRVTNGEFKRITPSKKGTFNCDPSNVVTEKLDLIK
jgi:ABC-type branched-subunit amino acid transport system substrate-binding protein